MAAVCHCVGQPGGLPCAGCPAVGRQTCLPGTGPCSGCGGRGVTFVAGQMYACTRCNGSGREAGPFQPIIVTC